MLSQVLLLLSPAPVAWNRRIPFNPAIPFNPRIYLPVSRVSCTFTAKSFTFKNRPRCSPQLPQTLGEGGFWVTKGSCTMNLRIIET